MRVNTASARAVTQHTAEFADDRVFAATRYAHLLSMFEESWAAHGGLRLAVQACWELLPCVRRLDLVAVAVCQVLSPGQSPAWHRLGGVADSALPPAVRLPYLMAASATTHLVRQADSECCWV